uniref:Fibrinogen C-terminal domain-containing protein n=1 Tax=Plectus sambesii TaxID=2011161 RepID=A0A914VD59_9BILA
MGIADAEETDPCIAAESRLHRGINPKTKLALIILLVALIVFILIAGVIALIVTFAKSSKTISECTDLRRDGETRNGIYSVAIDGVEPFNVYCDMQTDNGGWTVIQRRTNGELLFWNKKWHDYKQGFGTDLTNEFWLGLDKIHKLSAVDDDGKLRTTLRIDLWGDRCRDKYCSGHLNEHWWGEWDFSVADESERYRLKISVAKAGNLTEHTIYDVFYYMNNDQPFSTVEVDNAKAGFNCAEFRRFGGWWHKDCSHVALNGEYSENQGGARGFFWFYRHSSPTYNINPARSEMKIRRNN